MRAAIDTNVLIAGMLWRGPPHDLLQLARSGSISLVSSAALLAELAVVLDRSKFKTILARSGTSTELLLGQVRDLVDGRASAAGATRIPRSG